MTHENSSSSIESPNEQPVETAPVRSRRGFLKKTVATSLVGLTGLTAATKGASATESSDDDIETQAANKITVRGIADRTYYVIYSTTPIWGGDTGGAGPDYSFEYPQTIYYEGTGYDYGIDGTVYANNEDSFFFEGYVAVPDTTGITYTVEDR